MPGFQVTPDLIVMIAGVFLSLLFSYIPKLNTAFAALSSEAKRLIMLGLLVLTTAGIYAGSCAGIFSSGITCDQNGLLGLLWMLILSVIANQSTYNITPKTAAVRKVLNTPTEPDGQDMQSYG